MTKCHKHYLYYPGTIPDELPDGCEFFDVDGWIKESVHPRYWGIPARRWPVPEWKYQAHHWMRAFGIECPEGYKVVGFGLNEHPDHYILQRDGRVRYLYVGKIPHPLLIKLEPEIGGESEMNRQEAQKEFMCHKPIRHKVWQPETYVLLCKDGLCRNHNNRTVSPDVFLSLPAYDDGWEVYKEPKQFAEDVTDPALLKKFRESNKKIIEQGGSCSGIDCQYCVGYCGYNSGVHCHDSGWSRGKYKTERKINAKRWNEEHPEPELPYIDIEIDLNGNGEAYIVRGGKRYFIESVVRLKEFMGFISYAGELMGLPLMWANDAGDLCPYKLGDSDKEVRAVAVRLRRT